MSKSTINHCSNNSRDVSLEAPIGSASGFSRSFLIEVPLPWARIPLETPHIPAEVISAIDTFQANHGKVSVYLLAPDSEYAVEGARLVDVQVTNGRVDKREIIATDGDLAAVINALATDSSLPASAMIDETPWRDIALCTHGSRDACCATFGFPMYLKMRESARHQPHTRVWRCSHLGGHRFAPTMLDLPSGRVWGLVDEPAARTILLKDADASTLLPHYRGWVGYKDVELQMLEGEILCNLGWAWNEYQQTGRVLERDEEGRGVKVEIIGTHPTLDSITYTAEIDWGEQFTTIASCNAEPVTYVRKHLKNVLQSSPEFAAAD